MTTQNAFYLNLGIKHDTIVAMLWGTGFGLTGKGVMKVCLALHFSYYTITNIQEHFARYFISPTYRFENYFSKTF